MAYCCRGTDRHVVDPWVGEAGILSEALTKAEMHKPFDDITRGNLQRPTG
jgi:hypothetical protein